MEQWKASTQMKRVSVRTAGAGHAHSGVATGRVPANGTIAGAASDERATATHNIVVKLGTYTRRRKG